ncbi:MAG TPA: hypothetical protein VF173_18695 [Thermoanaerobaculia bacterium]|nr:hypothetical protein [Thermoanaerobaculia bacterium]
MRSSTLRGFAAALLLAVLAATDALPVFPAARHQCVMPCCRMQSGMQHGMSCRLRPASAPRCGVGPSESLPASLESQWDKADRPILRDTRPADAFLAPAGWIADGTVVAPPSPLSEPPVPPPRSPRFA